MMTTCLAECLSHPHEKAGLSNLTIRLPCRKVAKPILEVEHSSAEREGSKADHLQAHLSSQVVLCLSLDQGVSPDTCFRGGRFEQTSSETPTPGISIGWTFNLLCPAAWVVDR